MLLIGWDNETGEGLFTGDFDDLTKGKEATESLFDEGADIFIPVGGLIGTPGFDVARERGGYGIWVDVDGYDLLPEARDVLLTSVMKNMDNSCYDVINAVLEGSFEGCGVYIGSLENDGVGIAPYHDLESAVPDDLQAEVEALREQIISGEISDTRIGRYLESLRAQFPGTVIADMLCLLRVHLELSIRAKGMLLAREAGLRIETDREVREKLEELRFLETVGGQVCLAVEGARHLQAQRRREQEARALAALNKGIGESLEPDAVLEAVGRTARSPGACSTACSATSAPTSCSGISSVVAADSTANVSDCSSTWTLSPSGSSATPGSALYSLVSTE